MPYLKWPETLFKSAALCRLSWLSAAMLLWPCWSMANAVAYVEMRWHEPVRERQLDVKLWYPAKMSGNPDTTYYDLAFLGRAQKNADYLPTDSRRALILLSHGDRGSNVDQSWLAEFLAAKGYLVAAVAHFQNTWRSNTPEATIKVWDRPQDLSFVLDRLLEDSLWGSRIDTQRIAAAGHSAGGYSVLALLGAIYKPLQMAQYCARQSDVRECNLADGADLQSIDFSATKLSYRDPRIKAVAAMAPALGPGVTLESLSSIEKPVLIIAATNDKLLRYELNAAHYAENIPNSEILPLSQGGHFVFMPQCSFMGQVFTYFHRFDICGRRDKVMEQRPQLHAQIAQAIAAFFEQSLSLPIQQKTASRE